MLARVIYILRETLRHLSSFKFMTFTVIIDIAISLFLAGMVALVITNVQNIIKTTKSKIDLEIYMSDAISKEGIKNIREKLESLQGIAKISFISKERAYQIANEDSLLKKALQAVEGNPLPPSFVVNLNENFQSLEKMNVLRRQIALFPGVADISPVKAWLPKLETFQKRFMFYGTIILIFICINLFLVASNSIRLTINARRDLVKIMHLLGATRRTLLMPFILENSVKGTIGGIISSVMLFMLYIAGKKMFTTLTFSHAICIGQIFFGALLGILGSAFTMNRLVK